jgi:hypothetical protein
MNIDWAAKFIDWLVNIWAAESTFYVFPTLKFSAVLLIYAIKFLQCFN